MVKKFDFDLIVVGSGTAGSAAAFRARKSGLSVALVENGVWGGSGVNSRDLPFCSATSLSNLYHDALSGGRFGLSSKSLRFNYPVFKKWLTLAKKRSGANSKKAFESAGITCLKGIAHFLSPHIISVGEKTFSGKNFLIASGSVPENGGIVGLETIKCLTPETALDLPRLPKEVVIIGSGSTGCEFAVFFASLGVKVQLLELSDRLLPKEDKEAGAVLEKYLEEEFKVKVLTDSRVVAVSDVDSSVKVIYLRGGVEKTLKTENIFLATGARPALDLGLENAGVRFNKNGIFVKHSFQTSAKHIFAAGDCIGGESSPEIASTEGVTALLNLEKHQKFTVNYSLFPRVVKTNPEIVSIGKTEADCKKGKLNYQKIFVPLSEISASNTSDFRVGFLKLLVDKKKKTLLGATLMTKGAELMISELTLAMKANLPLSEIALTPHVSTSFAELLHLATQKV